MPEKKLCVHLAKNRELIESDIRLGKYQPQVILGVKIPNGNGKVGLLGVARVTDWLLQQAVGQVLAIKFEMEFETVSGLTARHRDTSTRATTTSLTLI